MKNVTKREGHRACFHATMRKNEVIWATFGNHSAQQIRSINFQCNPLYHSERLSLIVSIHLRPRKNVFKYPAFFIP